MYMSPQYLDRLVAEELAIKTAMKERFVPVDKSSVHYMTEDELHSYAEEARQRMKEAGKTKVVKVGDTVTVKSNYAMVKEEHQVYTTGEVIAVSDKYIKLKIQHKKDLQWLHGESYTSKFPLTAIHEVNGKKVASIRRKLKASLFTVNEVLQRILKTMHNIDDVEKYVGIRFRRSEHNQLIADIYDSRLGLNAPTIFPVAIYNTNKSPTIQRKEALGEFKGWLRGVREKVNG